MENLKVIAFEKWYGFYKLINNKKQFMETDTAASIIRIRYAIEDFQVEKKELCELLRVRGIVDNGISDSRYTYTENSRMYIRNGINLEKNDMSNEEFNHYIYKVVSTIVYDNIDLYFNCAKFVLEESEVDNIKKTSCEFDDKDLVKKILKLLYLFRNSNKHDTRISDLEEFLKLSAKKSCDYDKSESLDDILKNLVKKELIHVEWTGCYGIVSEEKKRLAQMISFLYKKVTLEEKNAFIFNLIRTKIMNIVQEAGANKINISIDIDSSKIYRADSDFILKLDNYIKENRDIRRGYYVLNTKKNKNLAFWYGKRILDIDEKAKYVIAYGRAIDSLEISFKNDKEKLAFLKDQKSIYKKNLDDFRKELEDGFASGAYIINGEDKKVDKSESVQDVFKMIVNKLSAK